jgi:hypothetical protein
LLQAGESVLLNWADVEGTNLALDHVSEKIKGIDNIQPNSPDYFNSK